MDRLVAMLRAAGDPTRLRLLLLLRQAELTVSELIEIVGQIAAPRLPPSQAFGRGRSAGTVQGRKLGASIAPPTAARVRSWAPRWRRWPSPHLSQADTARLGAVRQARAAAAAAYFKANAPEWERIRALHAPEKDVEAAILKRMTARPIQNLLDAGTGTGRMLELLAPHANRAVGVDVSPDMLAIARDRLLRDESQECAGAAGRHLSPAFHQPTGFDAVLFHQVLHYLDDPGAAVAEVARVMAPGGAASDRRFRAA